MTKKIKYVVLALGIVVCSTGFAQEWQKMSPTFSSEYIPRHIYKCSFINENDGWFIENYSEHSIIWSTIDGGTNWNANNYKQNEGSFFTHICFTDQYHGWVLGYKSSYQLENSYLLTTKDGGSEWNQLPISDITAITFLDSLNGFAGGENTICQTTDGGGTWVSAQADTTVDFYIENIFFVDKDCGWAAGTNMDVTDTGILLNTTDGGKTWEIQIEQAYIINDIYFTDSLNGVIVGEAVRGEGRIQRTRDGGKSWVTVTPLSKIPRFTGVEFISQSNGWAIGDCGVVLNSIDGGETWEIKELGTLDDLVDICFVENGDVGYIVGFNKTLLKYDSGISKVSDVDKRPIFTLSPNYPNPFNGSTTIQYDLAKRGQVDLQIYNIQGQQVATLYQGYQTSGLHSVKWDGRDESGNSVSSGIYFIKLMSHDQNVVKRMLYLK